MIDQDILVSTHPFAHMFFSWNLMSGYMIFLGMTLLSLVIEAFYSFRNFQHDPNARFSWFAKWSLWTYVLAGIAFAYMDVSTPQKLFNGMLKIDAFTRMTTIMFLLAAGAWVISSSEYFKKFNMWNAELVFMLNFSVLGMMLTVASHDLVVSFLGIELMSLSVVVMTGYLKHDRLHYEATIKYFILGSVASVTMLYGSALLYGASGSFDLDVIKTYFLNNANTPSHYLVDLGIIFILVGTLFKLGVFPFHFWLPDVYDGACMPVTGWMSGAVKAAALGLAIRWMSALGFSAETAQGLNIHTRYFLSLCLQCCAIISIFLGNLVAIKQTQLKRMLAYSSIAQSGYFILGLVNAYHSPTAYQHLALYMMLYIITQVGLFAVLTHLGDANTMSSKALWILDYRAFPTIAQNTPWTASMIAFFLLALAGLPLTGNFFAKIYLLSGSIAAGHYGLFFLSILGSILGVYVYLSIPLHFIHSTSSISTSIKKPDISIEAHALEGGALWVALLALIFLFGTGWIYPQYLFAVVHKLF